jgi:hypothetical protein
MAEETRIETHVLYWPVTLLLEALGEDPEDGYSLFNMETNEEPVLAAAKHREQLVVDAVVLDAVDYWCIEGQSDYAGSGHSVRVLVHKELATVKFV